jgi:nucleotide-binding universal stress UspA family protein
MRRVLVAVRGLMFREFLDRVAGQLSWSDAELHLLHVVDVRPLRDYGFAARGLAGRAGQAAERIGQMGALGAEAGQRMLAEAEVRAKHRLPVGTIIRRWQRTGVPEQEIIGAAYEAGATLIVLGAAEDPADPPPPPRIPHGCGTPGPVAPSGRTVPPALAGLEEAPRYPRRHLSPTVRFVVDHAPCDVLLLYAGEFQKIDM